MDFENVINLLITNIHVTRPVPNLYMQWPKNTRRLTSHNEVYGLIPGTVLHYSY